jgi:hypothetical protein
MQPKPSADTSRPLLPKMRFSMMSPLCLLDPVFSR